MIFVECFILKYLNDFRLFFSVFLFLLIVRSLNSLEAGVAFCILCKLAVTITIVLRVKLWVKLCVHCGFTHLLLEWFLI